MFIRNINNIKLQKYMEKELREYLKYCQKRHLRHRLKNSDPAKIELDSVYKELLGYEYKCVIC